MVEINNPDDLEVWLRTQNAELSAIIAARTALRILPQFISMFEAEPYPASFEFLVRIFRGPLNALLSGTWSAETFHSAANAAEFAAQSTRVRMLSEPQGSVAYAAGRSANSAYFAIGPTRRGDGNTIPDVRRAADHAARAASVGLYIDDSIWPSLCADVILFEKHQELSFIRDAPLWHGDIPEKFDASWLVLDLILEGHSDFEFWRRWYASLMRGGPQKQSIAQSIALLREDIWNAGPAAVAKQISKIEAQYALEPIPKTVLREQVKVLIQNAAIAQLSGDSLALQIEDAITTYLREEECNGLPDELSVLEHLPAALRRLTSAVSAAKTDESRVPELELSTQAMATEIEALKRQLDDLKSAKPDSAILQAFKQETGKMAARTMWGGLLAGSYMLLGEQAIGSTLTHIAGTLNSLWGKAPN